MTFFFFFLFISARCTVYVRKRSSVIYTSFFGIISGGQFLFFFHVFQLTFHAVCLSLGCDDPMLGLQGSARRAWGTSPGWLIAALMRDTVMHIHTLTFALMQTQHTHRNTSHLPLSFIYICFSFSQVLQVMHFCQALMCHLKNKFIFCSIIQYIIFSVNYLVTVSVLFYKSNKTLISKCTQCNLKQQEAH